MKLSDLKVGYKISFQCPLGTPTRIGTVQQLGHADISYGAIADLSSGELTIQVGMPNGKFGLLTNKEVLSAQTAPDEPFLEIEHPHRD